MSKTTIPQSIFGDQTNIKKCVQPPGGTSSIVFGAESLKADVVKCKNHQASDIFNLDENKEVTKKPGHVQQGDTKSRLFGVAGFNLITGKLHEEVVAKEEEEVDEKKDAEMVSNAVVSSAITNTDATVAATAAAAMPARMKQPPGGKSTKLW